MSKFDFEWKAGEEPDGTEIIFEDLDHFLAEKHTSEAYGKPTCWAIGALIIFIMLAIDATFSRLHMPAHCEAGAAPLAVITGLMILGAAACASKTLKTWIQEKSEHLLPIVAAFLIMPLIFSAIFDLFFGLSATSWAFSWSFALMMGLSAVLLALCSGNEIRFLEVFVAALASLGGSVLLWLTTDSLFLIALVLALIVVACLLSLWSKYVPLDELLFDGEDDDPDADFQPSNSIKEDDAS